MIAAKEVNGGGGGNDKNILYTCTNLSNNNTF